MSGKNSSNPAFDFLFTATLVGGIIGYSAVSTNTTAAIIGAGAAAKLGVFAAPLIVAGFTMAPSIAVVGTVVAAGSLGYGHYKAAECIGNYPSPITSCSCPQASQSIAPNKTQ